jgi:hypothetical protein
MAFLATSAAAQQKTEGRPLSQGEGEGNMSVLAGLRPGHPRLIALAEDWPRLQQLLTSNPELRAIRDSLQERAVRILEEPTVEHTLIGPRLLQESRRCLERVYTLAAMYRLTGEARFAERARKEMLAAAAFPDWNPSHFLDTAEMTHALAIGYDWLYDELGPEDRATIRQAIIEKGLEPAVACYHEKRWWVTSDFNWNQVCNGGIGIGALALADEEPDVAGYILTQALESLPLAMASYAPDGGWAEGPGYWHYATSYNVYLLAAFETALGSDRKLSALPGFDRTGFFRIYFVSPTGRTFNYADAGEQAGSAPEMFWLARTFRQPLFAWHQREHRGRRPSVLDLLWYRPEGEGPVASGLPLDACFTGIDVTFLRSAWEDREAIFLGCKGGDNQANHSHLDLGSFVLDAGGYRWAVDLGPDDYNLPDYFGGKRFTYYRLRTESHNTLTFADENQDPAAKAPIIGFGSNPGRAWAVADLSAPYAQWAKRARRGVALLARRQVLIQDEVDVKGDVGFSWRMLTPAEVTVADDRAVLAQGDWRLEARILAPSGLRFEVAAASAPPPQAQQPNVRVLSIRLPGRAGETRLAVLLTPYRQGEEAPGGTVALTPLDEWPGLTR